jgi:hypothetical protein
VYICWCVWHALPLVVVVVLLLWVPGHRPVLLVTRPLLVVQWHMVHLSARAVTRNCCCHAHQAPVGASNSTNQQGYCCLGLGRRAVEPVSFLVFGGPAQLWCPFGGLWLVSRSSAGPRECLGVSVGCAFRPHRHGRTIRGDSIGVRVCLRHASGALHPQWAWGGVSAAVLRRVCLVHASQHLDTAGSAAGHLCRDVREHVCCG